MNKVLVAIVSFLFSFLSCNLLAQNSSIEPVRFGGEYPFQKNDAEHPCITLAEYTVMQKRCAENVKQLGILSGSHNDRAVNTTLSWPLTEAPGFNDCDYYVIFEYVDQDTNPITFRDYNCGQTTYDGHRGTDIGIAPFPFYKMDHNEVEVIAAAPGIIIDKSDGHFDKNCALNDSVANYVIIQHADGSRALYWHMKKTSITTKMIGDAVGTGDYLGLVGSSGSATGPHLHIEVWSDSLSTSLNDPYAGPCNLLNNNSWWETQKPYTEPAITHCAVDSAVPILPACPATEIPNECKIYPAGGVSAYYLIFIRDETPGLIAHMRILNPNGSVFNSWTLNSDTDYLASYWYWKMNLPAATGTYVFEATYNGTVCTDTFQISNSIAAITDISMSAELKIYPNPSNGKFFIQWEGDSQNRSDEKNILEIYNLLGEKIFTSINSSILPEVQLDAPSGVYFCQLINNKRVIANRKLVIE